ncbi:SURP motif domain-containing protein [Haematococcus lacustris]|uniref:SURP motif domain-containing protein n=1 Tax=Haematococcus lacustris TaxID=44745 RepID=A0A699ZQK3_HAELA|nr:SURP motif domain-containing protein [Haematococcus lacustris]
MQRFHGAFTGGFSAGYFNTVGSKPEYDTFGASAAEAARSFAQQEAVARPSLIPGGVMEELVVPVTSSVGSARHG